MASDEELSEMSNDYDEYFSISSESDHEDNDENVADEEDVGVHGVDGTGVVQCPTSDFREGPSPETHPHGDGVLAGPRAQEQLPAEGALSEEERALIGAFQSPSTRQGKFGLAIKKNRPLEIGPFTPTRKHLLVDYVSGRTTIRVAASNVAPCPLGGHLSARRPPGPGLEAGIQPVVVVGGVRVGSVGLLDQEYQCGQKGTVRFIQPDGEPGDTSQIDSRFLHLISDQYSSEGPSCTCSLYAAHGCCAHTVASIAVGLGVGSAGLESRVAAVLDGMKGLQFHVGLQCPSPSASLAPAVSLGEIEHAKSIGKAEAEGLRQMMLAPKGMYHGPGAMQRGGSELASRAEKLMGELSAMLGHGSLSPGGLQTVEGLLQQAVDTAKATAATGAAHQHPSPPSSPSSSEDKGPEEDLVATPPDRAPRETDARRSTDRKTHALHPHRRRRKPSALAKIQPLKKRRTKTGLRFE